MNQIQYQVYVTATPNASGNTWFEMTQNPMELIGSALQQRSLRLGLKLLEAFVHVSLVGVEVGDLLME